jgi:hypothetical protein
MLITLQKGKKPSPDKGKHERTIPTMHSIDEEDQGYHQPLPSPPSSKL